MIRRTAHPPTDSAISLVEESGRVQRAFNFRVVRHPPAVANIASKVEKLRILGSAYSRVRVID